MKKFEIGKKYEFASLVLRTLDSKIGDIFTCHRIDEDGDAWSLDVTAFVGLTDDGGWCCANEEHLDDGIVIEVSE
jgi:hypothetical protein